MWGSLTSDLKEFVSNVTDDTTVALSTIDTKLNLPEVTATQLYNKEDDIVVDVDVATNNIDNNTSKVEEKERGGNDNNDDDDDVEKVLRLLLDDATTFTKPLLPDDNNEEGGVEEFCAHFSIESKTKEIATLLKDLQHEQGNKETATPATATVTTTTTTEKEGEEETVDDHDGEKKEDNNNNNNDDDNVLLLLVVSTGLSRIVKKQFETLVPTKVTYNEFWARYYYRCDVHRIQKGDYAHLLRREKEDENDVEDEDHRSIDNDDDNDNDNAAGAGISTFTNFLGGAVQAVVSKSKLLTKNDADDNHTKKRNPNYAVSSSIAPTARNMEEDEEEEEEEELGWGDESDSDDEEENDDTNHENVIEFTNNNTTTTTLDMQLKNQHDQRDTILQTIQVQKLEILQLKKQVQQQDGDHTMEEKEIASLTMELFEKNSEIAALKLRLCGDHDHGTGLEEENDNNNNNNYSIVDGKKEEIQLQCIIKQIKSLTVDQLQKLKCEIFNDTNMNNNDHSTLQKLDTASSSDNSSTVKVEMQECDDSSKEKTKNSTTIASNNNTTDNNIRAVTSTINNGDNDGNDDGGGDVDSDWGDAWGEDD